jgi:hypothetical protein
VPFDSLIGKATFQIPMAGYVMMDLFTYKGLAAGAMLAGLLIILFAVPALLSAGKKDRDAKKGGGAGEAEAEATGPGGAPARRKGLDALRDSVLDKPGSKG